LSNIATGEGSFDAAADETAAIRDQLDETADELDGVDPPAEAEDAHNRLVDSLHAYSDDLEEIQGKLERGNEAEIAESLSGLENFDSVRDLQKAGADLEKLGYRFEST
jgi:hypothetical protein